MLRKSTLREIRTSLARYLAIFSIVFLGVGFFAGLRDCKASMVSTATRYLDEHNLFDYQLMSSYGIDDDSVDIALGWDGVTGAEGSLQVDVLAEYGDGDTKSLKAISMPEEINTLRLVEGRFPESPDECLVDSYSIVDEGFTVGSTVKLSELNDKDRLKLFNYKEFKIVGTVNTPIYLDYQRGSTDIGNGSLDTFFYVEKDALDADYYTCLYLTLDTQAGPFTDELKDELDSYQDSMDDLADTINNARRETARKEAQDKLDEKVQEYEDSLAKYNREKAKAEKEIDDAEGKIKSGEKKIKSTRSDLNKTIKEIKAGIKTAEKTIKDLNGTISELNGTIAGLKSNKEQIEAGIKQAEDQKAQLEAAHEAGQIDDETYQGGIAQANAAISELNGNLAQVNAGLSQAEAGLKQATDGKAKAEAGLKEAKAGLKEAEAGLDKLDKEENKLDKNKKTLASEERKAESEFDKAKKELDDAKEKLDDAQEEIDDMETGNSYALSRNENVGYASFDSNSSIVSNIAKIFPAFFFLIAALVCMTTMTRMIDEQRTQIGVLKALGYSNGSILAKYMFYSGSAAFMGAVIGFFVGCKIFPTVIWHAYTMMYDFSAETDYIIDPALGIMSLAGAMLCSIGATWFSISRDFKVQPADLIRPKTPPAGKRILLERITPLWKRISFLYKVSFRNIFRDKKRFLMMVIGVSGCTALLIAGLGVRTSIARVADYQYGEISLYDFSVIFSKNMNDKRQQDFIDYMADETDIAADDIMFAHQGEVTMTANGTSYDMTLTAADKEGFDSFVSMHSDEEPVAFPGDGEVVIPLKISHDYGVQPGDTIKIRDGYREMEAVVSGVCDNYVFDTLYMSRDTFKNGFGKEPDLKYAMVKTAEDTEEDTIREWATFAANYDDTAAVSVVADMKDSVAKMMTSLDAIIFVVVLSAALLAFIVLYNLTNISITERTREIATIKVLGFRQGEVSQYVFRENVFLTAIAAVVGIPMGKWLLKFVIDNIVVKMIFFVPRLTNMDILLAWL